MWKDDTFNVRTRNNRTRSSHIHYWIYQRKDCFPYFRMLNQAWQTWSTKIVFRSLFFTKYNWHDLATFRGCCCFYTVIPLALVRYGVIMTTRRSMMCLDSYPQFNLISDARSWDKSSIYQLLNCGKTGTSRYFGIITAFFLTSITENSSDNHWNWRSGENNRNSVCMPKLKGKGKTFAFKRYTLYLQTFISRGVTTQPNKPRVLLCFAETIFD